MFLNKKDSLKNIFLIEKVFFNKNFKKNVLKLFGKLFI